MADVKTDVVLHEVRDRIATLTLNRPDRLNAWTGGLAHRYYSLLEDAAADPDVRVIVVTGAGRPSLAARFAGAWPRRRTGRPQPLPDRDLACPPDRQVRRPLPAGARLRRARHTPGPSRGLLDPPRRERLPCGEGRKYPGRPPTHRPADPHGRSQRDRAVEGNPEPHRRARPRRHLPSGQPRRAGLHGLAARVARASIRVAARGLHPARPRREHPRPRRREPRRPQPAEPHAGPGALAIGPLRGAVGGGDSAQSTRLATAPISPTASVRASLPRK